MAQSFDAPFLQKFAVHFVLKTPDRTVQRKALILPNGVPVVLAFHVLGLLQLVVNADLVAARAAQAPQTPIKPLPGMVRRHFPQTRLHVIRGIIEVAPKIRLEVEGQVDLREFEATPGAVNPEGFQEAAAADIGLMIADALDVLGSEPDVAVRLQVLGVGIVDPDAVMFQAPLVTGYPAVRGE
ncbi:hypothetical protein DSECCO2_593290 [anaerobic digester metagenome]